MGSPDFALPSLQAFRQSFPETKLIIFSRPDAPKGRNQKLTPTPIKSWALNQNLTVFTPMTKNELTSLVLEFNPDLIIVAAYGMIIPKQITNHYFCLNIHASLLPQYRGAAPMQAAILNNDPQTGITLMKIVEKLDSGPILSQEKIPLSPEDNIQSIHDNLADLGAQMLIKYLNNNFLTDNISYIEQNETKASYCPKIDKNLLALDLKMDPNEFINRVRAFSPYPGAYLIFDNHRYKILKACNNNGKIEIREIQPEGKNKMTYQEFLLGHPKGITDAS